MTASVETALRRLGVSPDTVARFCQAHGVRQLAFFGSVLRDDFRPDSDVDVLVTMAPGVHWSMDEFLDAEEELAALLRRTVDLVERDVVESAENYIRRDAILKSAEVVYAA